MSTYAMLSGRVMTDPEVSHELKGEKIYRTIISAERLSGTIDSIPVLSPERLFDSIEGLKDMYLVVSGRFQSYNRCEEDGKNKLDLFLFATDAIDEYRRDDVNIAEFDGYICKEPVYRVTPSDREICDLLVAVNRPYGKSDYIPCIAWGRNARWASRLMTGEHIQLKGRMQSRNYRNSAGEQKIAYEVSLSEISRAEDE